MGFWSIPLYHILPGFSLSFCLFLPVLRLFSPLCFFGFGVIQKKVFWEVLQKICRVLEGNIGDIVDYVPDDE